jgi:hypothetical protein
MDGTGAAAARGRITQGAVTSARQASDYRPRPEMGRDALAENAVRDGQPAQHAAEPGEGSRRGPGERQAGEGGLVAEFDDRRERDEDPGRGGDPDGPTDPQGSGRGRGVNSSRIATMTPNGDRAIASA